MYLLKWSIAANILISQLALAVIPSGPYNNVDVEKAGRDSRFSGVIQTHNVIDAAACEAFNNRQSPSLDWEGFCSAVAVTFQGGASDETLFLTAAHCLPASGCVLPMSTTGMRPLLSPHFGKHPNYVASGRRTQSSSDLGAFIAKGLARTKTYPLYEGDSFQLLDSEHTYHVGFGSELVDTEWSDPEIRHAVRVSIDHDDDGMLVSYYKPDQSGKPFPSGAPTQGDSGGALLYDNPITKRVELVAIYTGSKNNGKFSFYSNLNGEHPSYHYRIKERGRVDATCEAFPCYGHESTWLRIKAEDIASLYERAKTGQGKEEL